MPAPNHLANYMCVSWREEEEGVLIQRKEEEGKEGSGGEEPEDESVSISHLRAHTHTAPVEEGRRGAMITYR